jgi:excisionase family DNA binding protein
MTTERQMRPKRRITLDEIAGDWATVQEVCAWTGASKNTVYEWCRSGLLRDDVVYFGRQLRIPKKALARLMDGE